MKTTIVFAVAMLVGTIGFSQSTSSTQNETSTTKSAKAKCAPKAGAGCCSKAMSKNCAPKSGKSTSSTESKGTKEENATTASGTSKG